MNVEVIEANSYEELHEALKAYQPNAPYGRPVISSIQQVKYTVTVEEYVEDGKPIITFLEVPVEKFKWVAFIHVV